MMSDRLRVLRDHPRGEGSYAFRCPCCKEVVTRSALAGTLNLLTAANAIDFLWGSPITEAEMEKVEGMSGRDWDEVLSQVLGNPENG